MSNQYSFLWKQYVAFHWHLPGSLGPVSDRDSCNCSIQTCQGAAHSAPVLCAEVATGLNQDLKSVPSMALGIIIVFLVSHPSFGKKNIVE